METCKLIKRVLLFTLLLPFASLIPYDELEFTRTIYYTTTTTIVASYVFLINFPAVIQMSHTRPLNFQDLEDDNHVNPLIRKRFQVMFIITLQIFGALMITGMVDYYMYRYENTSLSKFEIMGVVGGFISLISKVERIVGKGLLSLLNQVRIRSPGLGPRYDSRFQSVIRKLSASLSGIPDEEHSVSELELGERAPRKQSLDIPRVATMDNSQKKEDSEDSFVEILPSDALGAII
jgi:hypothetical protein